MSSASALLLPLLLLAFAACGGSRPAPLVPPNTRLEVLRVAAGQKAHLIGNEHFRANMAVMGMSVGDIDVKISEVCSTNGMSEVTMVTTMHTSGVARWFFRRDGLTTTRLDAATALPAEQFMEVRDGGPVRKYWLKFSPGVLDFVFAKAGEPEKRGSRKVPDNEHAMDLQSAVILLRSWRPEPGSVAHISAAMGRGIWRAQLVYRGATTLEIGGTKRRAVWIEGYAQEIPREGKEPKEPRAFKLWFSDDAARVPLRISAEADYGSAEFLLESHEAEPSACPNTPKPSSK